MKSSGTMTFFLYFINQKFDAEEKKPVVNAQDLFY